jgi:hypothetical protein
MSNIIQYFIKGGKMGSRGNGSFGDYQQEEDTNKCGKNVGIVILEDVSLYDYFINNNNLPPIYDSIEISFHDISKRIVAVSSSTNEVIGALPTKFNFLLICLKHGFVYSGEVIASATHPILRVEVQINAN